MYKYCTYCALITTILSNRLIDMGGKYTGLQLSSWGSKWQDIEKL